MTPLALLTPSSIGSVEIRNRVIRSSTSETMADEDGFVTPRYRALHQALARGGVGLILTGHSYVHPSGKSIAGMTGVHDDDHIPLLHRLTDAVHAEGAKIFCQLQHAGSQSRAPHDGRRPRTARRAGRRSPRRRATCGPRARPARRSRRDLTPDVFETARRRAAEQSVAIDWIEGDAEELPFEDGRFDRVLSAFGIQSAPRHEIVAQELVRVTRPGGRIGLVNWTPTGSGR
ncbi:MAG: methyltransferase domain-containing protein [Solirubrobacteraceae bacterium]